ncbi:MAG TPA: methylated-DNA--[protein]-cysteine S-methyltransferase [Allosphingosinicella sp.]|nr:methylated-DNA--[protein]-cysteine S-methyltransferase [Allosphingosinicella sp.]
MTAASFALFDTAIGRCAIIWRDQAVIGTALPEASNEKLRAAIARRFAGATEAAPPSSITGAMEAIRRLLLGEPENFSSIAIDLEGVAAFERRVLAAALRIPAGETRTYGDIAEALGAPGAARAVGAALGRNPIPIIIPCHRVLAADGRSGGFSAPGGASTKLRLLEIEGARRGSEPGLFERLPWRTKPSA